MGIWSKFKEGTQIGVKAKISHKSTRRAEKEVFKKAEKWEKQEARRTKREAKKER